MYIYIYTSPHSAMVILPGNSRAMLHALITVFTFITDTLDVGNVPSAEQPAIQWLSQLSQGSATVSLKHKSWACQKMASANYDHLMGI